MTPIRLMIISDELYGMNHYFKTFVSNGITISGYELASTAMDSLTGKNVNMVLLNADMKPHTTVDQLIGAIATRFRKISIILYTEHCTVEEHERLKMQGIVKAYTKNDMQELTNTILAVQKGNKLL